MSTCSAHAGRVSSAGGAWCRPEHSAGCRLQRGCHRLCCNSDAGCVGPLPRLPGGPMAAAAQFEECSGAQPVRDTNMHKGCLAFDGLHATKCTSLHTHMAGRSAGRLLAAAVERTNSVKSNSCAQQQLTLCVGMYLRRRALGLMPPRQQLTAGCAKAAERSWCGTGTQTAAAVGAAAATATAAVPAAAVC